MESIQGLCGSILVHTPRPPVGSALVLVLQVCRSKNRTGSTNMAQASRAQDNIVVTKTLHLLLGVNSHPHHSPATRNSRHHCNHCFPNNGSNDWNEPPIHWRRIKCYGIEFGRQLASEVSNDIMEGDPEQSLNCKEGRGITLRFP